MKGIKFIYRCPQTLEYLVLGKVGITFEEIMRKTSNFFEVLLVKMVVRLRIENSVFW